MNVGVLLTKAARTYPKRLAIACGDYELTYQTPSHNDSPCSSANGSRHQGP
jgi:hypothetical protein